MTAATADPQTEPDPVDDPEFEEVVTGGHQLALDVGDVALHLAVFNLPAATVESLVSKRIGEEFTVRATFRVTEVTVGRTDKHGRGLLIHRTEVVALDRDELRPDAGNVLPYDDELNPYSAER